MVEVLKALTLLDAGRKIRRIEKTMKRLQMSGHKLNPKLLGKFKSNTDNLAVLKPSVSALSTPLIGAYMLKIIVLILFC